jgi:regulator of sigma E protease
MMNFLLNIWDYAIIFLVVLTVVVFVHETGHFLVARWCGVKIETFSIGFGPELFGRTAKTGTRWRVSMLPIGGYVKMFGDADPASTPDTERVFTPAERAVAFHFKTVYQRAAIIVAGPAANFIFAIVALAIMLGVYGDLRSAPVVGQVQQGGAAAEAGLQVNDRIIEANGRTIASFQDISSVIQMSVGEPIALKVQRDGENLSIIVHPRVTEVTSIFGVHKTPLLGIVSDPAANELVHYNPATALIQAVKQTKDMVGEILTGVGQMIMGQRDASEAGGPLRIAKYAGATAKAAGFYGVVKFIIMLSVNLGLLNLFPVPILDGGHLLFCLIEAVRGRPLGERAQEYGFRAGAILVLGLMLFTTRNDLLDLHVWDLIKRVIS